MARKTAGSNADVLNGKCVIAWQQGDMAAAEAHARAALRLDPLHAGAHNNLGMILHGTDRKKDAQAEFRLALASDPFMPGALSNLGGALADEGLYPEAEALLRRAIEVQPDLAAAHNNLGLMLLDTGRIEESIEALRKAFQLNPKSGDTLNSMAAALHKIGRTEEAMDCCKRALELTPDLPIAHVNIGLMLLARGDYANGWPEYEARLSQKIQLNRQQLPEVAFPQWNGEPIDGKSILIWREQGFGDEIQFVRYAKLLKARGARQVVVCCKPQLTELLRTARDVDLVVASAKDAPRCDFWSAALSLPMRLGTTVDTVPADIPYLHALPRRIERWRDRMPPGFRVGLVWKGDARHRNDGRRSLPSLHPLAPLWEIPGVSFVSLQKGRAKDEAKDPPEGQPLVALGHEMSDFADAAAIVSQLDLIICVDTAIAHVAGALGKPVWVLLPSVGTDWRWLRDRTDSPWYPGVMRLFRQGSADANWKPVVTRLAGALSKQVEDSLDVERLLDWSVAAHRQKRFAEALWGYEQVLAMEGENPDAWHLKGLIEHDTGRSADAENSIRRAIALKDSPLFHENLAVLLNALGRRDEARDSKARATALQAATSESAKT